MKLPFRKIVSYCGKLLDQFPIFLSALKQGRIHGYPSHVRVGRGSDEVDQLGSWAGAGAPKPPVIAEKAKCYRLTDGQTDQPTERVVESRARD